MDDHGVSDAAVYRVLSGMQLRIAGDGVPEERFPRQRHRMGGFCQFYEVRKRHCRNGVDVHGIKKYLPDVRHRSSYRVALAAAFQLLSVP